MLHTTLCWSSDKLWVLRLHCSYWFCFSVRWFSGPSAVKLFQKVIPPSRYMESRHLTTQKNKQFHTQQGWKVSDFPPEYPFSKNTGALLLFSSVFAFIMYLHSWLWHYWQSMELRCHSIDRLAVMYSTLPALTHHSLADAIYFCTGHKELHQTEMSKAFLWHLQP